MLSNLLSVLLAPFLLGNASGATGLSKDALPFEDKVIYNLQEEAHVSDSNNYLGNGNIAEVSIVLQFSETFSCAHKEMDAFEEVLEHRQELKNYYSQCNANIVGFLNLADSSKVVVSNYGPFIEYIYDSAEDFYKNDYEILKSTNPELLEKVYIEQEYREEYNIVPLATRNDFDSKSDYQFSKALKDVGIPEEKPYKGDGIKIGSIETGTPLNYVNFESGTYEVHGNNPTEHSFWTSSIFGGTSGIANNAKVYFTSLKNYTFFENAEWLIEKGVNIINCSYGYGNYTYSQYSAYADYLVKDAKITFITSAGNVSFLGVTEPSAGVNVISVASNDFKLAISSFSSFGINSQYYRSLVNPTLTAPGERITGVDNWGSTYVYGTSFAAPFVTGIVAMLMEEFPILQTHPELVMALLTNSCTKALGQVDTYDTDAGFGIVNYELARQNFKHSTYFDIDKNICNGYTVYNTYIELDFDDKLTAKAFVLLNRDYYSKEYVELDYSDITFKIFNEKTGEEIWGDRISNFGYIEYSNTTYLNSGQATTIFWLEICVINKYSNNYQNEHCAVSYSIERYRDTHSFEIITRGSTLIGIIAPENFNGHFIIPKWITEIDRELFYNSQDVVCVTFEEGSELTTIGEFAFSCCYNLRFFMIPESVTLIGGGAFSFSEDVSIYTGLEEAPSGWSPIWGVKTVDYDKMVNDSRNGTLQDMEYYYTYHEVIWGVTF